MPNSRLPQGHTVRPMSKDDLAVVTALESASQAHPWTSQQFADELCNTASSIDLYLCDGELAGFLCSWLIAGELQIQNLVVGPGFRRRGIAARLLRLVMERSRQQGLESGWLEVRSGNAAAIALYEGFGFKVVDCRRGYYHDGEDALIMSYQAG